VEVRLYRDPDTGLPHIYAHGVTESEVEDVLRRPAENRPGRMRSRVAIGHTRSGRLLRVVYVPDADGSGVFAVKAFDLHGKALRAFRRRARRRGDR
jgi:hypothetical protein